MLSIAKIFAIAQIFEMAAATGTAIRSAKPPDQDAPGLQPVDGAFRLCEARNADDAGLRRSQQVIDMPAEFFVFSAVSGNACFQITTGTAGVDIIAGGEKTGAESADDDMCVSG